MKKTIYLAIMALLLSACSLLNKNQSSDSLGSEAYKSVIAASHETANITAQPDEETSLELSDGAKVFVPAGSASKEVEIVLERNPEKAKTMPALGEYAVPVSSFYNIEPKGEGLVGPVEIQLPVDRSLIPEGMDGELVALFPDGKGGWRSETVNEVNGKAVIYTDELGDPIIAWHFGPYDPTEKQTITVEEIITNKCKKKTYFGIGMNECIEKEKQILLEEIKKATRLCYSTIPLQAVVTDNNGTQVDIVGQVLGSYAGSGMSDDPGKIYQDLPVEITFLSSYSQADMPKQETVKTDSDGKFSLTRNYPYVKTQLNTLVKARAVCPGGNGFTSMESKGFTEFYLLPPPQEAADVTTPTVEPVKPPEGAVAVPDVVGLSLEEATKKLEELGFRTTWVDGKSSLELGQIYQQKPAAGEYLVPHRTTVVIFRTVEKEYLPMVATITYEYKTEGYITCCGSAPDDDETREITQKDYRNMDAGIQTIFHPKIHTDTEWGDIYDISSWEEQLNGIEEFTIGNQRVKVYKYSGLYENKTYHKSNDHTTIESIELIRYYDTKYGFLLKEINHSKLLSVSNCISNVGAYGLYTNGTTTKTATGIDLKLE